MRFRSVLIIPAVLALTACPETALETRTFALTYLDAGNAEQIVRPYVLDARGELRITRNTITVRGTRADLERIARVLAEQDQPPPNVRLVFQVIRADGAAPPDSAIAAIETQLRQLFRFRGYRLVGQAFAVATEGTELRQHVQGPGGPYIIEGQLETVSARGDSGSVRLMVRLAVGGVGQVFSTRVSVPTGQTAVIGGQSSTGSDALILAVRPELVPR